MTATVLKFPHERINAEPRHCEAKILHIPQRQADPLEDAMVAYYRWVLSFTRPFNV